MQAFLQASGLWRIVNGDTTCPAGANADAAQQATWDMSDDMAQGNLTLRLSHNVRNQVGATSANTWTNLQTHFGTVGVSHIYGDFRALVNFKISGTQNLSAEIKRFSMHQQRLIAHGVALSDNIIRMIILAALPSRWDHVSAIYLQGKSDIVNMHSAEVRQAIVAEFDQTYSGERQQAQHISAIKRKGEHPKYKGSALTKISSTAEGDQCPSGSSKKTRHGGCKGKGKGRAHIADRFPSPNLFTLAAPATLVPARPMIALQPSRAGPQTHTIASIKPTGVTYSTVAAASLQWYTGASSMPGKYTMQEERSLLKRLNVKPTTEPLKMLAALKRHGEFMNNSPAVQAAVAASTAPVATSSKKTLEDIVPPHVNYMPKFGGKRKVRKTLIQRMGLPNINNKGMRKGKIPLTPSIVEVTDEEEESPQMVEDVYNNLFGDHNLNREIVESAGLEDQVSAIQVNDYRCGTYGVFDDHYDPRQLITEYILMISMLNSTISM